MKKVFKILGIIIIIIVVLVGGYSIFLKVSDLQSNKKEEKRQKQLNEERINAKSLMEYVKTHSGKYLNCNDDNCYPMEFTKEDFKCDALDSNIKFLKDSYFITKDNEIYDISLNELYSNNQNCKKRDTNIEIKNIVNAEDSTNNIILSKDNKIYDSSLKENKFSEFEKVLLNDTNIIKIIETDIYNNYNDYMVREISALVLKRDNKIYKQYYNEKATYNDNKGNYDYNITFKREEIYKSLEEYGNINDIEVSSYYMSDMKEYKLEKNTITKIISDKGYYYLDEIKTDECTKYKDIECKLELKESEIYKKFSKDIKALGETYTILSDNSVIRTDYLTYPLDKDLKN